MEKLTIKSVLPTIDVHTVDLNQDYGGRPYASALVLVSQEHGLMAVWPKTRAGRKTSRMAVKVLPENLDLNDKPSWWQSEDVGGVVVYDHATGDYTVPYGPRGAARAFARWIKDNL